MAPRRTGLASIAFLSLLFIGNQTEASRNSQAGSPGPPPVKRALLIGINHYKSESIPPLRGAVNDIEAAVQVLSTRFGFGSDQIRKLIDEKATRSAILAALNEMAKVSGPEDWIYIHYSGHGSQADDLNGDEEDKLDETLVPYDGRTGDILDIIDDELGEILARFRSPNVVIVLDACHSGTGTRGMTVAMRSIPKDTRSELYRRAQPTTRAVVPMTAQRHVLMSGAAANQPALDGPIDSQYRGIFSYALLKTLASHETGVPARTLIRGIETELNRLKGQLGLIDMPEPQLEAEGNRIDGPLFSSRQQAVDPASQAKRPWVAVEEGQKGQVLLKNAVSLGATAGSTWLIYPPGEMEFSSGKGIASARVTAIRDQDAIGDVQPAETVIPKGCRAITVAPAGATTEIPVLFAGSTKPDPNIQQELQKLLPEVRFVGPNDFARFIVVLENARCQVFGAAGLQPLDDFLRSGNTETVQRIAKQLARAVTSADLLSLENVTSGIRIEVEIPARSTAAVGDARGSRGIRATPNTEAPRFRIRNEGESRDAGNSLQLQVRCSEDAYITIVDVDQEGGINLLFPNEIQSPDFYPEGKIRGGETVLIPDSLTSPNRARFNMDMSPPAGIDTIRVFAAKELKTAELIRQYIRNLRQLPAGQAQRAPFAELRRNLIQMAVTRGVRLSANEPSPLTTAAATSAGLPGDWNAAAITIVVETSKNR